MTKRMHDRVGIRRLFALLIVVAVIGAACGSSDDNTASETADGDTGFAETTEVDFGDEARDEAAVEEDFAADDDAAGSSDGVATEGEASEPSVAVVDDAAPAAGEVDQGQGDPEVDGDEGDVDQLGSGGSTVTPTAAELGRKLIFTAEVHVGVDDVESATAEATKIVEDIGGFVFGQSTVGGVEPSSQLIFKVLPDDFNRTLEELGSVGELRNQSVSTDDVTERVVNLESRIEVAQLGVDRLRAALEGAATLEDYAEIETLLLNRESDLEVMRGQLRTLEDQVNLATITLLLTQDRLENLVALTVTSYQDHNNGESCTGDDFSSYEAGVAVTLCFEVTNLGDQTLTEITLSDTVLEIDSATELIEVFGTLDELAPGQSTVVAFEIEPERDLRLRTTVAAVPTDGVSPEPSGPTVTAQVERGISVFEPSRPPGFGDGFGAAVGFLAWLWRAFLLVLGFAIPLLVLAPFAWLVFVGLRRIRRNRPPKQPMTAPPPPYVNQPVGVASGPGDAGPTGSGSTTTGPAPSGSGAQGPEQPRP